MIITSLTIAYTRAIFQYGTHKFENIRSEYVEPVKQRACVLYDKKQIDKALAQGWITEKEHADTLAYLEAPTSQGGE